VGAYAGREEIMQLIAPCGAVYQAGTLSGNPIAMAAGLAQLEMLENNDVYKHIDQMGAKLAEGIAGIIQNLGLNACVNRIGSLVCLFFGLETADSYQSVKDADRELYARYFRKMLAAGVYLAPAQFEAMFVSYAHTEKDIDETLYAAEKVLKGI
jgi:glutamate-1-semialdehyde 2,1-aminomutase